MTMKRALISAAAAAVLFSATADAASGVHVFRAMDDGEPSWGDVDWVESNVPRPGYDKHGYGDVSRLAQQCVWYNTTTGKAMYYQDACVDLAVSLLWWVPAAIIYFAFLALFPLGFLCFRYLCNCCGGRMPSFACCCPSVFEKTHFPGYSRCSVWGHKVALAILMVFSIGGAVTSIVENAWLNIHMRDDVLAPLPRPQISDDFAALEANVQKLSNPAAAFGIPMSRPVVSPANAATVEETNADIQRRVNDAQDDMKDARTGEDVRHRVHNAAAGMMALVGLVLLIVALFNGGCVIPAGQLVFAWIGLLLLVCVCQLATMRGLQAAVCGAYTESVVPIAVAEAEKRGVCDHAALLPVPQDLTLGVKAAIADPSEGVCKALAAACSSNFQCAPHAALNPCGKSADAVALDAVEVFMKAVTRTGASQTMWECANSESCADAGKLKGVVQFQAAGRAAITEATAVVAGDEGCLWLEEYLQGTGHERLCDDAAKDNMIGAVKNAAYCIFFAVFALIPLIRGIKRFRCDCCALTPSAAAIAAEEANSPLTPLTATVAAGPSHPLRPSTGRVLENYGTSEPIGEPAMGAPYGTFFTTDVADGKPRVAAETAPPASHYVQHHALAITDVDTLQSAVPDMPGVPAREEACPIEYPTKPAQ